MVKINKVTTRTGDDGRTNLGDGSRVPKFDTRIMALGAIDEANSFLGLACHHVSEECRVLLHHVQNDLFDVGADLCKPERNVESSIGLRLDETQVQRIDEAIATANKGLPSLTSFAMPGGNLSASYLHVARSIVRRAEREVVEVAYQRPITPTIIRYLNRLSDLLFVLARRETLRDGVETLWRPGQNARLS